MILTIRKEIIIESMQSMADSVENCIIIPFLLSPNDLRSPTSFARRVAVTVLRLMKFIMETEIFTAQ